MCLNCGTLLDACEAWEVGVIRIEDDGKRAQTLETCAAAVDSRRSNLYLAGFQGRNGKL